MPILMTSEPSATSASLQKRDTRWLSLLGKRREGASLAEVQGRLSAAASGDGPGAARDSLVAWCCVFRMLGKGNSELRALSTAATVATRHDRADPCCWRCFYVCLPSARARYRTRAGRWEFALRSAPRPGA